MPVDQRRRLAWWRVDLRAGEGELAGAQAGVAGRLARLGSAAAACGPDSSRNTCSVSLSAGKKHSMRISCTVTSCGVPSVVMVVNIRSEVSPLRKWMFSTGPAGSSSQCVSASDGTAGYDSRRCNRSAVSLVPSAAASAWTLRRRD